MSPITKLTALVLIALGAVLASAWITPRARAQDIDAAALYQQDCASCHGANRFGGIGPALLPESLSRLRGAGLETVIGQGRPASQMPGFAATRSADQIAALATFLRRPPATRPRWGLEEIRASYDLRIDPTALPDTPVHDADPLNLFTVVEAGDHAVTILDGDRFEPLDRFKSRYALHGGAKYSPDGRFVYLASRDGWISLYDLYSLQTVAEIRAGLNTRNAAVSADGRYVMVGNMLPPSLVLLDARDLRPIKIIPVKGDRGTRSRVSAVYTAPPRESFIVALKDIPELWEISYADDPRPVYPGLVHNYTPGQEEAEGVDRGPFPVRRIKLDAVLDDFFFDPPYRHLIGAARDRNTGQVINLNVGRKIAELPLAGMPHLGSGITWQRDGRPVMATPLLKENALAVIDMTDWQQIARIDTLGPGFFLRSHDASPYAWADVFFGPNRDAVHVIDKQSLKVIKTLRPAPGKVAAHVEFTRDGRYALLSVWDDDGALVIYDATTLTEVKRLPMRKPVGKYNVYNKITYARGTSH